MEFTKQDIKTLEKIKNYCNSVSCCDDCIFYDACSDLPLEWDFRELKELIDNETKEKHK